MQAAYKAQADQVIQTQATLNDTQKLITELFDQKINGFVATPYRYYYKLFNWTLDDLVNYAAFQEAVRVSGTFLLVVLRNACCTCGVQGSSHPNPGTHIGGIPAEQEQRIRLGSACPAFHMVPLACRLPSHSISGLQLVPWHQHLPCLTLQGLCSRYTYLKGVISRATPFRCTSQRLLCCLLVARLLADAV
jgi:hypothetical protein